MPSIFAYTMTAYHTADLFGQLNRYKEHTCGNLVYPNRILFPHTEALQRLACTKAVFLMPFISSGSMNFLIAGFAFYDFKLHLPKHDKVILHIFIWDNG